MKAQRYPGGWICWGRKLGMKKGLYFMNVIGITQAAIAEAKGLDALKPKRLSSKAL